MWFHYKVTYRNEEGVRASLSDKSPLLNRALAPNPLIKSGLHKGYSGVHTSPTQPIQQWPGKRGHVELSVSSRGTLGPVAAGLLVMQALMAQLVSLQSSH